MLAQKLAGGEETPQEAIQGAAMDPSAMAMQGSPMDKAQMEAMMAAKAAGAPGMGGGFSAMGIANMMGPKQPMNPEQMAMMQSKYAGMQDPSGMGMGAAMPMMGKKGMRMMGKKGMRMVGQDGMKLQAYAGGGMTRIPSSKKTK
jgi:hypothetical protein